MALKSLVAIALASMASAMPALVPISADTLASITARKAAPVPKPPTLAPLNVDAFLSASGLKPRDAVDFSRLDPKTQAQMVYGAPGDDGNMMLANMTLYAPDHQPIIMFESFEGLTSSVDCNGDDGLLSLTFTNADAFNYALAQWTIINEDTDATFLAITNHAGCGPDNERAVYTVTDVDNDEANFIVKMNAQQAAWEDVTGTFDLDFGQVRLNQGARRKLMRRGWLSDAVDSVGDFVGDAADAVVDVGSDIIDGAVDVGGDIVDAVGDGVGAVIDAAGKLVNIDTDKSGSFDISIGTPHSPINIYSADHFKLDCSNCFVGGTLAITGKLRVSLFDLKELSLRITPQNLAAALEISATFSIDVSASGNENLFTDDFSLFEAAIPGAGIDIPHIFTLGGVTGIDVGFSLKASASITFTAGLDLAVANQAEIFIDIANIGDSSATGFGETTITPVLNLGAVKATVDGSVYLRPKVALKAEVASIGKAEVSLNFDLPKITASGTLKDDPVNGACPDQSKAEWGLGFHLGAELNLNIGASVDIASLIDKNWNKNLFSYTPWQNDWCFPIDSLGDAAGATTSTPAALSAPFTAVPAPIPTTTVAPIPDPAVPSPSTAAPVPDSEAAPTDAAPAVSSPSSVVNAAPIVSSPSIVETTAAPVTSAIVPEATKVSNSTAAAIETQTASVDTTLPETTASANGTLPGSIAAPSLAPLPTEVLNVTDPVVPDANISTPETPLQTGSFNATSPSNSTAKPGVSRPPYGNGTVILTHEESNTGSGSGSSSGNAGNSGYLVESGSEDSPSGRKPGSYYTPGYSGAGSPDIISSSSTNAATSYTPKFSSGSESSALSLGSGSSSSSGSASGYVPEASYESTETPSSTSSSLSSEDAAVYDDSSSSSDEYSESDGSSGYGSSTDYDTSSESDDSTSNSGSSGFSSEDEYAPTPVEATEDPKMSILPVGLPQPFFLNGTTSENGTIANSTSYLAKVSWRPVRLA